MKKYSLLLLPFLAGIAFWGCDSECCSDIEAAPPPQEKQPPVAKILLNGSEVSGLKECTPGETVTLTPASSDSDGTVAENIWKIDGLEAADTTITCPDDKESTTVCLVAMDNDGLYSKGEECVTFTGKATVAPPPPSPSTTPPVAIATKGELTGDDGIFFNCSDVHDTDAIHTYPGEEYLYGSNTPKDIKEVIWEYTYYKADGTIEDGPNAMRQSAYNAAGGHVAGTCSKWFHINADVAKIDFSLTTIDDDKETNTTAYSYDVATGTLTQK